MAYAIIETGGKQYRVSPGSVLEVELLEANEGDKVAFDKILIYQDSQEPVVGTPYVTGMVVTAEVLGQAKGPKVRVFTYKPKKRQRRTVGHRQLITQIKIEEIKKLEKKVEKAEKEVAK